MTSKLKQGDVVHILATVETEAGEVATVVVQGFNGQSQNIRINKALVKHHERGPVRAGDVVYKKTKAGKIEGTVVYRDGDLAWVSWSDDLHGVELVTALSR